MRRRATILGASPTLVGAVAVLVGVIAVFLAYNANSGLPFVPSYRITAQVPNADSLVPGNEVRVGGVRVGFVEAIEPVQTTDGEVLARLELKLDPKADPVPVDSTVIVRARSALGLKYLEIVEGSSAQGFGEGEVMPLSAARPQPVDLDELLGTFDVRTRLAIRRNLTELGNALAGRGDELNAAIGELPPLLWRLGPVMANLAAPQTELGRFFAALGRAAAEVAPVAEVQAALFVGLDATFGALASVARPYVQEAISESPSTLRVGISELPRIRPFLANSRGLLADLAPGAVALRTSGPEIALALEEGIPVLRDAPALNRRLPRATGALLALAEDPEANAGLARLTGTVDLLRPTLRFVTPAQTVCNYATLLLRNVASVTELGDGLGTWQRFIVFDVPKGPNSEGSPSSAPASGGGDGKNFLHVNPYPNTAAPGQPRECEAGNEPFIAGRTVIGNVPGNQGTATEGKR